MSSIRPHSCSSATSNSASRNLAESSSYLLFNGCACPEAEVAAWSLSLYMPIHREISGPWSEVFTKVTSTMNWFSKELPKLITEQTNLTKRVFKQRLSWNSNFDVTLQRICLKQSNNVISKLFTKLVELGTFSYYRNPTNFKNTDV